MRVPTSPRKNNSNYRPLLIIVACFVFVAGFHLGSKAWNFEEPQDQQRKTPAVSIGGQGSLTDDSTTPQQQQQSDEEIVSMQEEIEQVKEEHPVEQPAETETISEPENTPEEETVPESKSTDVATTTAADEAPRDWKKQVTFMVIGAMKGGTTSMHAYTMQHPRIVANERKELRCFTSYWRDDDPYCEKSYNISGLQSDPDYYITGDYSPGYIWTFVVSIPRIKFAFPWVNFIAVLRNPIDRAFSQHSMNVRQQAILIKGVEVDSDFSHRCVDDLEDMRAAGLMPFMRFQKDQQETMAIEDWHAATIDKEHFLQFHGSDEELLAWGKYYDKTQINRGIVSQGFYSLQIHQWFREFPKERFLFLKTENLAEEEGLREGIKRTYAHIGIEYVPLEDKDGANKATYKHEIDIMLNQTLQKIFAPYTDQLEGLLGEEWVNPWPDAQPAPEVQVTTAVDEYPDFPQDWKRQVKFMVIGAMKGGTTSMHAYTMQHPRILHNERKELRCFTSYWEDDDPYCEKSYNISGLQSNPDYYITGDYSPGYIWYFMKVIPRIKNAFPWVNFITVLRNPIDRAFSQHTMDVRNNQIVIKGAGVDPDFSNRCVADLEDMRVAGLMPFMRFQKDQQETMTIEDWHAATLDKEHFLQFHGSYDELLAWGKYYENTQINRGLLSQGFYSLQIREWFKEFPKERFLFLKTENLADEHGLREGIRRTYAHIGIEDIPLDDLEGANRYSYEHDIDYILKQTLDKIFAPYNEQLEGLLGEEWVNPWPAEPEDEYPDFPHDWKRQVKFMVIGAMKGGTTSMHSYTMQHPRIVHNARKELRCFTSYWEDDDPYCEKSYNITGLQSDPDYYITGDYSPGYIWTFVLSIPRIKFAFPWVNFIAVLRNPIDRAFSQHSMDVRHDTIQIKGTTVDTNFTHRCVADLEDMRAAGLLPFMRFQKDEQESMAIEDWHAASLDKDQFSQFHGSDDELFAWHKYYNQTQINRGIVSQGFYSLQIRQWFNAFPRERFLFLKTENLAEEEGLREGIKRTYAHIGIEYIPLDDKEGANRATYKHEINEMLNQTLQKIFAPYTEQLEGLLGEEWVDPW